MDSLRNSKNFKDYNNLLVVSVALRLDKPLITFDKEQRELYEKITTKL